MQEPLITVIVPVYNVEGYLKKCIESIIRQTYRNLEIILVDDGSLDGSGRICDDYAGRDSRIVVIHKENGGLSDARNTALDVARGTYITYIDSDDYVADDYIEYLYKMLEEYRADISACLVKSIYNYDEKADYCDEKVEILNHSEAIKAVLFQKKFTPSACGKLYKRELFNTIRYPKGMYYEDMAVIYKLIELCDRIVVGRKQKYYYYQRQDSIIHQKFNEKKMHRIQIANELKEYVDEKYPELKPFTSARCFKMGLMVYREVPRGKEYEVYKNEAWQQIIRYRRETIKNREVGMALRGMAVSTYFGKKMLTLLGNVYSIIFK